MVCKKPQHRRGLCRTCYDGFLRDEREGRITEEEAIAAGMILPSKKRGPKPATAWDERVKQFKRDPKARQSR